MIFFFFHARDYIRYISVWLEFRRVLFLSPYVYNTGFDDVIADSEFVDSQLVVNYSFTIEGLSQSRGVYFAITAFDYGNAQTNLSSLESAKSINATLIFPIDKGGASDTLAGDTLASRIMVYPNPYKTSDDYVTPGYESPGNPAGWAEQDRRLWFSSLPDNQKAIIRIWSLDGDLIRAVTYDPTSFIGSPTGVTYWDLISRNGQAVVSGIYLYSIEFMAIDNGPNRKSEIGKFVIIKWSGGRKWKNIF